MIKKTARTLAKTSTKLPNSDSDGNQIHNEILLSLPREECDIVFPKVEFLRLNDLQILHEVGDTIKSAYFCNSGMISTLSVFPDGKSVEVGLIGKDKPTFIAAAFFVATVRAATTPGACLKGSPNWLIESSQSARINSISGKLFRITGE